ncbi:MAG: xerD 2 [Frankiales bacterium]|nr:xerD 2 [Frankiales bacterium]
MQGVRVAVDGQGRVVTSTAVRFLNAADVVVEEMFDGWRRQQLSRNLSIVTVDARERLVRRFLAHANEMPWHWSVAHVDEFFGDLRIESNLRQSTVRAYQNALRLFCAYLIDPGYGWDALCQREFGTYPTQVCFEWNTAAHAQSNEQHPTKRAFTHEELQAFFDRADDEVVRIRAAGRKGALAAFRDATLFKVAYAWGLRRNEVRHLQHVDFERNPNAREFGRYGAVNVRWGKSHKGSSHKRRTVLTVFDWSVEVVDEWISDGLPALDADSVDLFPSERGTLVSAASVSERFRRYRQDLGLSDGLDVHSLRRSYVTHLIEAGFDPLFVQKQAGHEHASTLAIYEFVSDDYRTSTLRHALDSTVRDALRPERRQR